LDNEKNKFDIDREWWMYKQMYQKQRLRKQFIDKSTRRASGQTNGQVKKDKAEAY
jgi:hypothetical protein